jgi:hypothetical protein
VKREAAAAILPSLGPDFVVGNPLWDAAQCSVTAFGNASLLKKSLFRRFFAFY